MRPAIRTRATCIKSEGLTDLVQVPTRLTAADSSDSEYPQDLTNKCYVIADGGRDSSTDPDTLSFSGIMGNSR